MKNTFLFQIMLFSALLFSNTFVSHAQILVAEEPEELTPSIPSPNCASYADFTYTLECLCSEVKITVTANYSAFYSEFEIYTLSPNPGPLDVQMGQTAVFIVPYTPNTPYVIKHKNRSLNCGVRESTQSFRMPTLISSTPPNTNFTISALWGINSNIYTMRLTPASTCSGAEHAWYVFNETTNTIVGIGNSTGNNTTGFTNLNKTDVYKVYHLIKTPCSGGNWFFSSQTYFVKKGKLFSKLNVSEETTELPKNMTPKEFLAKQKMQMNPIDKTTTINRNRLSITNEGVDLYPNPASDVLNIMLNTDEKVQTMNIYDIQGQFVQNIEVSEGQQVITDISNLSKGIYFIRIQTTIKLIVKKFSKL